MRSGKTSGGVSSKRDLQESPTRQEAVTKRPRTTGKGVSGPVDLSQFEVDEYEPVTEVQVPGASSAVSTSSGMRASCF